MVFGKIFCKASRLPIYDGDHCILIPLGFNMRYDFDRSSQASVKIFINLYQIIDRPQRVIYEGNINKIKYLDLHYKSVSNHQLFMLIHLEFYNEIIKESDRKGNWFFRTSEVMQVSKTCFPMRDLVWEMRDKNRSKLETAYLAKKITKEDFQKKSNIVFETPDDIRHVCQLVHWMESMDIEVTPSLRNSGRDTYLEYETFVTNAATYSKNKR